MAVADSQQQRRGAWAVTGIGMALLSAAFTFLLVYADRTIGAAAEGEALQQVLAGPIAYHAAGGLVAGLVFSPGFGRAGALGWILMLLAGAAATVTASALGAGLEAFAVLHEVGRAITMAEIAAAATDAFLVVPLAVAASPFLGLLWFALAGAIHTGAGAVRNG